MILRAATIQDVQQITQCVNDAYNHYLERMNNPPQPMLEDYSLVIKHNQVSVFEQRGHVLGLIVLHPSKATLLLKNIAVHPSVQGQGIGTKLLNFAESEALNNNLKEITLFTNECMIENIKFYTSFGYVETNRENHEGYSRVFMTKVF